MVFSERLFTERNDPMSITRSLPQSLLRSPVLAALTSPHGVDRYLEQVNPMWAAHDVRARIVDVHREVDVPGPPSGRHRDLPADLDLARPHRRPARAARRRGPRRPAHHPRLHRLQPRLRTGRPVHHHPAGQPRRRRLPAPGRGRPPRRGGAPLPGPGRLRAAGPRARPRPDDLRWLRHHPGDVDAARACSDAPTAAGSPSCTTRRAPSTRSSPTSSTWSGAPATAWTCTCCTPSSATRP